MQLSTFTTQVSSQVSTAIIGNAIALIDDAPAALRAKIAATLTYDNAVIAANWANAQARFWVPLAKSVVVWSTIAAIFGFFTLCQWAVESGRIVRQGYDMGDLVQVASDEVMAEMEQDRRELSPVSATAMFPVAFFHTFMSTEDVTALTAEYAWAQFRNSDPVAEFVNARQ